MKKPGFGVVTFVVVVLCFVGICVTLLRPLIPPTITNRLSRERDDFMVVAQHQPVDWHPLNTKTIADARRAGRPILLLIGTSTSRIAEILDEDVFPDNEIAGYLNRNFTCLRVDGMARPEWLNAYLPFSRFRTAMPSDFQLWALDPSGRLFGAYFRSGSNQATDRRSLRASFIGLRRQFDALAVQRSAPISLQSGDISLLEDTVPGGAVPFGAYRDLVRSWVDASWGGFARGGVSTLYPLAWRYQLETGDREAFHASLDPLLRTPQLDLIDGGFFHSTLIGGDAPTEFGKVSVENAEALLALAEAFRLTGDAEYRSLAKEVWRYLSTVTYQNGAFSAGQAGRVDERNRSERYSFSSARLRDLLNPDQRAWARAHLGLNLSRHPQGVPYLESAALTDPETQAVLAALRQGTQKGALLEAVGYADPSLTIAARCLQAGRLLGDRAIVDQAIRWIEDLEPLRNGSEVLRRINEEIPRGGYLGDYLAYADARLQDYLATGRVRSLELGLDVLRRAREQFKGSRPGAYVLNRPEDAAVLPEAHLPELADNLAESCTARMVRLTLAYGRLLGDTPEGQDLQREANAAVNLFSRMAADGGPQTAGFFRAAAETTDDAWLACVGPHAQEDADALAQRVPARLVAPVYGPVRQDLQRRSPGIYLVRGNIEGPLSVQEAANRLAPTFDLGLTP